MNFYETMLAKAAIIGQKSDVEKQKIGAILVYKKKIISTGFNKQKSHPLQSRLNRLRCCEHKRERTFIHAEIDCLRKLKKIPAGSKLFIGRIDKNGIRALSRPCEACLEYIRLCNIKEIVYNTSDGYAIEFLD